MVVNVVQVERRLITVDEYEQMVKAGVFREDDRLELIEGDLVKMSPIGAAHAGYVKRLNRLLSQQVSGKALIAIQDPVRLIRSEPEPDIALLRPRADDYIDSLPQAADIVLVVEVADTSVDYDRQVKLPLRGKCLVVVIDASTLMATDATMHDQDDTGLLAQLGPVTILTRETTRPSQDP